LHGVTTSVTPRGDGATWARCHPSSLFHITIHHHIPSIHNPPEGLREWEWRIGEGREEQRVWEKRGDWEGYR
jgi:hypothetical protein